MYQEGHQAHNINKNNTTVNTLMAELQAVAAALHITIPVFTSDPNNHWISSGMLTSLTTTSKENTAWEASQNLALAGNDDKIKYAMSIFTTIKSQVVHQQSSLKHSTSYLPSAGNIVSAFFWGGKDDSTVGEAIQNDRIQQQQASLEELEAEVKELALFLILAPLDQQAGYTPQHLQNFSQAAGILKKYISPYDVDNLYREAIAAMDCTKLALLKQEGFSLVTRESLHSPTVLHDAVREGNLNKVKFIIEQQIPGLNINEIQKADSWAQMFSDFLQCFNLLSWIRGDNGYGETALQLAMNEGKNDIAAYLLSKNADVNIIPANGRTVHEMIEAQGITAQQFQNQHLPPQQQPVFAPPAYQQHAYPQGAPMPVLQNPHVNQLQHQPQQNQGWCTVI